MAPDAGEEGTEVERDLEFLRDRILNVVGHELRTPVSTVRGLADALGEVDDPVRAAEILAALRRHASRLERLIDDVLAATGVTTSLPVGPPAEIRVASAVRVAWAEADGAPADLVVDDPDAAGVAARPGSATRIFGHVLGNAKAYGQGPVTVTVRAASGMARIEVASPGPPLSPEDIAYAPEALWRGERAVTTVPGLGLGLAVARALALHEGGGLTVDGLAGGGLRTVIDLPGAPASVPA